MEMEWAGKMLRKDFEHFEFSCFHNLWFPDNTFISDIIKVMDWGSNRVIRQQGFRILPLNKGLIHIKKWKRITDPYYMITESSFISQMKGQSVIVVHIKDLP